MSSYEMNEKAKDFLAKRRSVSVKDLKGPGPGLEDILEIINSALRVPDHGKLEPWRVILILEKSKEKFLHIIEARGKDLCIDEKKIEKNRFNILNTPLIIAIIGSPKQSTKIPQIEQTLSTGALCLNVVNNFLAHGWGANWLTGWMAHDKKLGTEAFNLMDEEFVAGFIYVGNFNGPILDRPRPKVEEKITYF